MTDKPHRRAAFVLSSVEGGAMILNRFDYSHGDHGTGVGASLLEFGAHQQEEIDLLSGVAMDLAQTRGSGILVIDAGANIGTHTVQLARRIAGFGSVVAFEAQQRIFYALAGNIALNNLWNAEAIFAALGERNGRIGVPVLNPVMPANFGGLSLRKEIAQDPGQEIDWNKLQPVEMRAIDGLNLPRLDLLKLDVEGMEPEVLRGAAATIERFRPVVLAEWTSCGEDRIKAELTGYRFRQFGPAVLAIHCNDPLVAKLPPQLETA